MQKKGNLKEPQNSKEKMKGKLRKSRDGENRLKTGKDKNNDWFGKTL